MNHITWRTFKSQWRHLGDIRLCYVNALFLFAQSDAIVMCGLSQHSDYLAYEHTDIKYMTFSKYGTQIHTKFDRWHNYTISIRFEELPSVCNSIRLIDFLSVLHAPNANRGNGNRSEHQCDTWRTIRFNSERIFYRNIISLVYLRLN